jgi:tetratricopeptide (TPR) repeat protein
VEESEITRLEQQLSVAEETGDRSEECNALRNLVVCLYQLGQFSPIVGYHQKWLSVAREIQNSWQEAVAQWYLGYSYKALEMQSEAIEALSQAYRLFRKMGNQEHSEQAWTWLNQLGDSYLAEKQYGKAQDLYQNQREILQEFNDQKMLGGILQNLGKAQFYQGNYQSAIESHTLMLEIARYVEDQGMESLALAWLGCARTEAGQLDFALHYFKQRLALTKTLNDTAAQRETLGWLVNLCKKLGGDGILPCFYMTEQIELFRQLNDKDSECSTLYELGNWHFALKQYPEAIKSFLSAIAVAEDQHIEKANSHYMLAHCYRNLEQVEAIEHYQTAIELYFEQNSHKEWAAKALDYLSAIYQGLNDYEKAIAQQQKRLDLVEKLGDRSSELDALWTLGCLFHNDIQQYTQALDCFSSYLKLANLLEQEWERKYKVACSHYMLGSSYEKLYQIDEAITHYHQAEILYTETGNEEWIENSRLQLQRLEQKKQEEQQSWKSWGDTLYDLGRYEEAIAS